MIHINLLPVRVSKKKELGKQQLILFVLVLILGVVGNYVWNHLRGQDLAARKARLTSTREESAKLERIIGEVKNIKAEQASLKEKLDVLDKLKAGRSGPVRVLDELATIPPKRLWFRKLSEDKGGAATFDGSAVNIDDVSAFMKALKESRYFSAVELKKTSAKTDGAFRIVDFTVTAKIDYAPPAASAAPAPAATPGK